MGLWDIFKSAPEEVKSKLQLELENQLNDYSEEEIKLITSLSGLFAKVIYSDMQIDSKETEQMKLSLNEWTSLPNESILKVVEISTQYVREFGTIEGHMFCGPLNEILSKDERYNVLVALFSLAASDGSVEAVETEEIRTIARGLNLDHPHFVSAKATVLEHLKALKR